MGQLDKHTDSDSKRASEGSYEIVDSLFDSCDDWQCRKCGMRCLESKYHRCDTSITKTVCEYCKNYSEGRCMLKK